MNTSRIFSGSTVQWWCLSSVPPSDPVLSVRSLFVSSSALKCIKTETCVLCNLQEQEGCKWTQKRTGSILRWGAHCQMIQCHSLAEQEGTDPIRLTLPGVGSGSKGLGTLWRNLEHRRKGTCNLPTGVLCACWMAWGCCALSWNLVEGFCEFWNRRHLVLPRLLAMVTCVEAACGQTFFHKLAKIPSKII